MMLLFTLLGSPDLRIQSSVLSLSDFDECNLVRIAHVAKWIVAFFTLIAFDCHDIFLLSAFKPKRRCPSWLPVIFVMVGHLSRITPLLSGDQLVR